MKLHNVILPLLLLIPLSGCGGLLGELVNPYEENFKCRTRDDAGKCIDTSSAYKEARFPDVDNAGETSCTNVSGDTIPCPPATTADSGIRTNINQLTAQNSRYKALTELMQEPDKPMLEPPKIMRVLMLPYKGENDELFMTRYVYLKLKESGWVLTDISEKAKAVQ
ncbi:MAG: type IV conjugative transfer system lipoprotein TraV [Desulforhopalus sp.]|nr:type IV conjugative transfer system lipoprotein TraV [Desulforhopalus sp.]